MHPPEWYPVTLLHSQIAPSSSKSVRSNAHIDHSSFFHQLPSDHTFGWSKLTWSDLIMGRNDHTNARLRLKRKQQRQTNNLFHNLLVYVIQEVYHASACLTHRCYKVRRPFRDTVSPRRRKKLRVLLTEECIRLTSVKICVLQHFIYSLVTLVSTHSQYLR